MVLSRRFKYFPSQSEKIMTPVRIEVCMLSRKKIFFIDTTVKKLKTSPGDLLLISLFIFTLYRNNQILVYTNQMKKLGNTSKTSTSKSYKSYATH